MSEAPKKSSSDSPRQVQYVMAQPIPNGYTVQGITVPHDGRQVMYNDDVMLEVIPQQKTKVIIANQTGPTPTVCTSSSPQLFYCTNCNKTLVSVVNYNSAGMGVTCCSIFLCIICFPWSLFFLCCLPFGASTAIHSCPQCGRNVGSAPAMM